MAFKLFLFLLTFLMGSVFQLAAANTEIIAYQVKTTTQTNSLHVLGSLRAYQSTHLFAPVSEQIKKIHITDSEFVSKNQLLFEFNDAEEQAMLKQIQLEVLETRRQHRRLLDIKDSSLVTQAQIDEKYTAWQTALAKQKSIEVQITDRKILAPFSGQLGLSDLSIGNRIEAGETLVSLDDVDLMKLDVLIPSRFLSKIYINQTINVQSDAYPNTVFKGSIVAVSPQLEAQSRMVKVRAHIENKEHKLKTNMMVKATINLKDEQVLSVPNSAVIMLGDNNFIYRLIEQDKGTYKAEKVTIKTGQIGDKLTEIKSGLTENDLIVSQGAMRVKSKSVLTIKAFQNDLDQAALLKAVPNQTSLSNQQKGQ